MITLEMLLENFDQLSEAWLDRFTYMVNNNFSKCKKLPNKTFQYIK